MKHNNEETRIEKIINEIENAGNEYGDLGLNQSYKNLIINTILAANEAVEEKEKQERKLYFRDMPSEDALALIQAITNYARNERDAKRMIRHFVNGKISAKQIKAHIYRSEWLHRLCADEINE